MWPSSWNVVVTQAVSLFTRTWTYLHGTSQSRRSTASHDGGEKLYGAVKCSAMMERRGMKGSKRVVGMRSASRRRRSGDSSGAGDFAGRARLGIREFPAWLQSKQTQVVQALGGVPFRAV